MPSILGPSRTNISSSSRLLTHFCRNPLRRSWPTVSLIRPFSNSYSRQFQQISNYFLRFRATNQVTFHGTFAHWRCHPAASVLIRYETEQRCRYWNCGCRNEAKKSALDKDCIQRHVIFIRVDVTRNLLVKRTLYSQTYSRFLSKGSPHLQCYHARQITDSSK